MRVCVRYMVACVLFVLGMTEHPPTASDQYKEGWVFTAEQLAQFVDSENFLSCADDVVAFSASSYLPPYGCQLLEEQISRGGNSLSANLQTAHPELIRRWEDEICVSELVRRVADIQLSSCVSPVSYKILDSQGFGMTFRNMVEGFLQTVRHGRTVVWSGEFIYGGCAARNLSCVFQRSSGCHFNCPAQDPTCEGRAQPFLQAKKAFGEADTWLTDPEFAACFTGINAQIRWVAALSSVLFEPLPALVEEARSFRSQMPRNFVGIHVRHHSGCHNELWGRTCHTLLEYADAVLQMEALYQTEAVFVATDNQEVLDELRRILPARLQLFCNVEANRQFLADSLDSDGENKARATEAFPKGSPEQKLRDGSLGLRAEQARELLFDVLVLRECRAFVGTFGSALSSLYLEMAIHFNSRVIPFIAVDGKLWRPASNFAFPGDDYFWRTHLEHS